LFLLAVNTSVSYGQECYFAPTDSDVTWVEKEPGIKYGTWSAKARAKSGTSAATPSVYVHLLRVDLSGGDLTLRSLKPLGRSKTIEAIVDYFREGGVDVRAAINGDYFSFLDAEKDPNGLHVSGGQLLFFPNNTPSLMITSDNVARMDRVSVNATATNGKSVVTIDTANRYPGKNGMALYSGFYDTSITTKGDCRRMLMTRTKLEATANGEVALSISSVKRAAGEQKLEPMEMALVACGKRAEETKEWKVGDVVKVKMVIPGLSKPIMEAISGGPRVLRGGKVVNEVGDEGFSFAMKRYLPNRHPRSAVGVSGDGKTVWLLVGEGRVKRSGGLNAFETGCILKGVGASDALLFDGGGSSTLFLEGKFMNQPHVGQKRTKRDLANCLGVVRLPKKK